jgi:hypothetical protein
MARLIMLGVARVKNPGLYNELLVLHRFSKPALVRDEAEYRTLEKYEGLRLAQLSPELDGNVSAKLTETGLILNELFFPKKSRFGLMMEGIFGKRTEKPQPIPL